MKIRRRFLFGPSDEADLSPSETRGKGGREIDQGRSEEQVLSSETKVQPFVPRKLFETETDAFVSTQLDDCNSLRPAVSWPHTWFILTPLAARLF